MREELEKIVSQSSREINEVKDAKELQELKVKLMGKKGSFTSILRSMADVPADQRPALGKLINEARERVEAAIAEQEARFRAFEKDLRLRIETLDVTVPGRSPQMGGAHPLSITRADIEDIFLSMGFEVVEGPEIELDLYNFELLNVPKDHPARDMQDSFYISDSMLLRTHTSPMQARTMLAKKPPIKIVCPGRVYRYDEVDATHSPVFHQMEGLLVDRNINMGNLRGMLDVFAKKLYGSNTRTRLRPSYFPFTEPSAEMDVSCYVCGGQDENCRVCRGGGWIEIMGCGMVNPKVLEMCGIDSGKYSGFAFGMGIDRITVSRYGISDLRTLFENDMRFLTQFMGG